MGVGTGVGKGLPRNLELRGDVYYVRVMVDGRRRRISTGHTTLRSAIRRADEIKVQLRNDRDFGKAEAPFFDDWAVLYLKTYTVRKKDTWRDHDVLAAPRKHFAKYRLDEITPSMCERYLTQRSEIRAKATVNLERAVLGAVFQKAVEDGLIEKNPWRKTTAHDVGPRIRVLSPENEDSLRAILSPRYQRWLTFMLGTGLRIAEARAIRVEDIDFAARLIHVPAEVAKGGKKRDVPLFPAVEAVVKAELAASGQLWHQVPQVFQATLKAKAIEAGIPHLSPHDLRHTFATRFLKGGGDIYTLSRILGHASVVITEKTYVHLVGKDLVEMTKGVEMGLTA